jgi:transcriptional regulator with XRE-family HTH domain
MRALDMGSTPRSADQIVSENIRRRRMSLGLQQAQLAIKLGRHVAYIEDMEAANVRPTASGLVDIANCSAAVYPGYSSTELPSG